jgi:hypothetical protein
MKRSVSDFGAESFPEDFSSNDTSEYRYFAGFAMTTQHSKKQVKKLQQECVGVAKKMTKDNIVQVSLPTPVNRLLVLLNSDTFTS